MTKDFKDMMYLLGYNNGMKVENEDINYDIEMIRKISLSQGLWSLVYPELERHVDMSKYLNEFMTIISKSLRNNIIQLETISELEKRGHKCCILKGISLSKLYPLSECRVSADTDILIKPEEEQDIIKILVEKGYRVEHREKNDHHFKAYHPTGGMLEGHVRLYSIPTEKIILSGKKLYSEPWREMELEGYTVHGLGINDGLIYLTAHYIKHLVNSGGGVRQMLDLLLYMDYYKDQIDLKKYEQTLKDLKYDKLIDVVKSIGAKYWGFDYKIVDEELCEELLTDCESGGIFGGLTTDRNGFYNEYCMLRENNKIKYGYINIVKSERGIIKRLFPSQKILLQQGYGLARHRILIPALWVKRPIDILKRIKNKNESNISSANEERLNMMKRLRMIE